MENLSNAISGVTQLLLRIWKGGIMKRRREDKQLLFWPVFTLTKAMPPAYEYDSLFHPRFKMFTVNSRHNGSQRIATFCLFHFSLMNLKNCIRKK
jgi:hypothetical protein